MTYEEAKMQIQAIPEKIWDQLSEPDREAMEMAFSALQEQEAKAQLSAEGTTSDLISRRVAVDALWEIRQKEISDGRRFHDYCSLSTAVDVIKDLPSAHPEIEERKEESAQNVPKEDLISRKAAIDVAENAFVRGLLASPDIRKLPSAQPETAKRIVGKSRNGMTLWYQCDMCNEPVDAQDNFCRGCGRRLTDG
jgi:hypothetical protein